MNKEQLLQRKEELEKEWDQLDQSGAYPDQQSRITGWLEDINERLAQMEKVQVETVYDQMSEGSLKEMHDSIRRCLEEDDQNQSGTKKYGVRTFPDWKMQKDAIEESMIGRNIDLKPINNL